MHSVTDALSLAKSMRENAKGIVEEHDISDASCCLAATVHGDAKIGLFEREHIIHPVTDHCHFFPLALEVSDLLFFVFGQHFGQCGIDTKLRRNAVGDGAATPPPCIRPSAARQPGGSAMTSDVDQVIVRLDDAVTTRLGRVAAGGGVGWRGRR